MKRNIQQKVIISTAAAATATHAEILNNNSNNCHEIWCHPQNAMAFISPNTRAVHCTDWILLKSHVNFITLSRTIHFTPVFTSVYIVIWFHRIKFKHVNIYLILLPRSLINIGCGCDARISKTFRKLFTPAKWAGTKLSEWRRLQKKSWGNKMISSWILYARQRNESEGGTQPVLIVHRKTWKTLKKIKFRRRHVVSPSEFHNSNGINWKKSSKIHTQARDDWTTILNYYARRWNDCYF